jgi:hypothetical protein
MQRDFGSRTYSGAICTVYMVCTVSLLGRKTYVLTRSGCSTVHNRATVQGVLDAATRAKRRATDLKAVARSFINV